MISLVISGGQKGADLGGLAAAKRCGIATGGTIPKGFLTEDGPTPELAKLGLVEHSSPTYPPRTYSNAKNSDGTIRFASNFNSPGEKCTLKAINYYKKPYIDVDIKNPRPVEEVVEWILANNIQTLNVAGNRESTNRGTFDFVVKYLTEVLTQVNNGFERNVSKDNLADI